MSQKPQLTDEEIDELMKRGKEMAEEIKRRFQMNGLKITCPHCGAPMPHLIGKKAEE